MVWVFVVCGFALALICVVMLCCLKWVWIAFNAFLCASLEYLILLWSAGDCGWFSGLEFVLLVSLRDLLDLCWRVWFWFDLVVCCFWVWCTCLRWFVLCCV